MQSAWARRGKPEESRAAILKAAVAEFAREGVAGARTDAIARSARVNKALLYYYFKDKEALYQAVLDDVFIGVRAAIHGALSQPLPPRQRLTAYVCAHFDYIASHPLYPRIVHAEFLRAGRDPSRLQAVAKQYFRPIFAELSSLLREGEQSGDFRPRRPHSFRAFDGRGDYLLFPDRTHHESDDGLRSHVARKNLRTPPGSGGLHLERSIHAVNRS